VKYLILIYSNPMSRALWAGFSPAEQAAGFQYYAALTEELTASGELVVAEALAVRVRDGQTLTTDGPFAEAKEHLMGIYLVQCASPERAVAIAGRIPEADYGLVEVRPIMTLGGPDM
jgi:hypothetical protein